MSRKFLTPISLPADPTLALEAVTKQYVDARAGSEVEINPNDPIGTNPNAELWYDTDAPAILTDDARWNTAWGMVASAGTSPGGTYVNVPAGSSTTPVTNTMNVTLVSGRRYRLTFQCRATNPVSSAIAQPFILWDGGGSVSGALDWWAYMPAPYAGFTATCLLNGDGAAHAYTVRASQNGGQAYAVYVDNPVSPLYIEDIGPVVGSVAIPNPTPAWIAPSLLNGWRNYGSGFTDAGYRLIGDEVKLRGMMTGGTLGTTLFVLPPGYRPTRAHIVPVVANDLFGQCRIGADGIVSAWSGTAGWYSIDNLSFSVT